MSAISEFGVIEFVRSDRANNIRVRIFPGGLKVTLPRRATEDDAMHFIRSVEDKIRRKQDKIEKVRQRQQLIIDEYARLETLTFTVNAQVSERKNIYFLLKNSILKIEYPIETDCSRTEIQTYFWNGIAYFLRKEAKRILPDRTRQLAEKFGFNFNCVKIQASKSRWGSCSRGGNINLSFYLLLLPAHLVDYVILHELCHTKEMNHGVNFWRWLNRVTDNKSDELKVELKKHTMPN
jgi:predicted metal-dependent hydrolase